MKKVMGLKWSCGHYSSSAGLVFLTFQVRQIWASILGSFALFWPTRCQQDITKPTNITFNWRTRPVNMTFFWFSKKMGVFHHFLLVCWSRGRSLLQLCVEATSTTTFWPSKDMAISCRTAVAQAWGDLGFFKSPAEKTWSNRLLSGYVNVAIENDHRNSGFSH